MEGEPRPLTSYPEKQYAFGLREPVSDRLDRLVELVRDAGGVAYRKEIVAALILYATTDPMRLDELVRQSRIATDADLEVPCPPQ